MTAPAPWFERRVDHPTTAVYRVWSDLVDAVDRKQSVRAEALIAALYTLHGRERKR